MVAYLLRAWLNEGIMNNFTNNSVERFPADTRMELPDMSYEHELLMTPVPFANRVEFLSDIVKLTPKSQTARDISKELSTTVDSVAAMARETCAASTVDDMGELKYEPFTQQVIEEELEWQKNFDNLDEHLSIPAAANYVGRSKEWVVTHAAGLDLYPEYRPLNTARPVQSYPKSLVDMLRTINLHFPPANDLYNIAEVEKMVGKSSIWINKMIELHKLPTSMRTTTATKRIGAHFSEETVAELNRLVNELPEPAGNNYTAHRIGEILSKSDRWVNARLIAHVSSGKEFLDDFSRVGVHYPQEVFEALREMALEVPPADGWFTNYDIQRTLGVGIDWINAQLKNYKDAAEVRLSIASRPALHYPPGIVEEVEELAHNHYGIR